MTDKMVIVKYTSARSGLTKRLLGYREWITKTRQKTYLHKPVVGKLQRLPIKKAGRAAIITPQRLLPEVREAITGEGGTVIQVEPVIIEENQAREAVEYFKKEFVDIIAHTLDYASEAPEKNLYISTIDKGIGFTKKFEAFLGEFSIYSLRNEDSEVIKMLRGLKSIADEDLEVAKMQAKRFATEIRAAT